MKNPDVEILHPASCARVAVRLLATLWLLSLASCALTPSQKEKAWATGAFLGERLAEIAGKAVLNSAIDALDRDKKSDFLHSAASGLRSEMLTIVNADDVRRVVEIWTPAKPHWSELAANLADAYQAARQEGVPPAKAVEAVAEGVESAPLK